jgi:bifunctional UDP-N-acetylglucosamine pyrophosphorylase/glucosamine-1-phosphate N-acetyltransferase
MPLLTADFICELINFYRDNPCAAVVTAINSPENKDFGHVFADEGNNFIQNIEARDLTTAHGQTPLRNTGCYIFNAKALKQGLAQLSSNNAQNEFYLTDVPMHIKMSGQSVKIFTSGESNINFIGINTQAQLAEAALHMRRRINEAHMANGVRMIDPSAVYIDAGVKIAADVILYPGVVLEGDCEIQTNTRVLAHSVLTDSKVGANAQIGPFAYLRPKTVVGDNCRIGNFVELKNAKIGNKTSAAHLIYVGDAEVGSNVNIGCGVITANYDGKRKHKTVIENNTFIGSNSTLIAPVTVKEGAFIAAGSTINEDVPADNFAIARGRQVNKTDWKGDPRKNA